MDEDELAEEVADDDGMALPGDGAVDEVDAEVETDDEDTVDDADVDDAEEKS